MKARYVPASNKLRLALEKRARWVIREWERSPTAKYAEMIAAIRERYGIGETMAEVTYARAREIIAEAAKDWNPSALIARYLQLYEVALADKKYAAATRVLNSLAVATGMVTKKHEVTMSGSVTVHQMKHVDVLRLTPIERGHRERALLEKAGMLGVDESIVDTMLSNVIDIGGPDPEQPTTETALAALGEIGNEVHDGMGFDDEE